MNPLSFRDACGILFLYYRKKLNKEFSIISFTCEDMGSSGLTNLCIILAIADAMSSNLRIKKIEFVKGIISSKHEITLIVLFCFVKNRLSICFDSTQI